MSSIKKDVDTLKKENKGLLKTINKATATLNKGYDLSAVQQQAQLDIMRNSMKQLQGNFEKIRILQDVQSELKQMWKAVKSESINSGKNGGKQDLVQLTVPQIENFKGNTVKRSPKAPKTTAAQRKKTGNRVRL